MKENTLPFGSEAHLLVLVRQLCNCAKLGKDYQPKAKGEAVTSSAVQKALPTRDSESKVFKFEASCITVGLFDTDSGVKRCEHGAQSAECLQRAA